MGIVTILSSLSESLIINGVLDKLLIRIFPHWWGKISIRLKVTLVLLNKTKKQASKELSWFQEGGVQESK